MDNVFGLVGLLFYIAFVLGLSASVTYGVVRLTSLRRKKPAEPAA